MPAGTQLEIGSGVIEITAQPHTGCRRFVERFGVDAMKLVNSARGRELRLRGANARVVRPGVIRTGDVVRKIFTLTVRMSRLPRIARRSASASKPHQNASYGSIAHVLWLETGEEGVTEIRARRRITV